MGLSTKSGPYVPRTDVNLPSIQESVLELRERGAGVLALNDRFIDEPDAPAIQLDHPTSWRDFALGRGDDPALPIDHGAQQL